MMDRVSAFLLGIALLIGILAHSFFVLDQREQALVLQFGKPSRTIDQPGLKFKIPLIQNVLLFDKRIKNLYADSSEVITLDQKTARVDAYVKYRIRDVLRFYQAAQNESKFKARLGSILDSSLRQVLGSMEFKVLLSEERANLMMKIRNIVNKEAESFGVDIIDVRISRTDLPDKSREAVSRRMRANREQEAREIRSEGVAAAQEIMSTADKDKVIIIAKAQEESEVMRGEGDAEAMRIINTITGKDIDFFNFYRSLEVYNNIFDSSSTVMILSPDNKFLRGMLNE